MLIQFNFKNFKSFRDEVSLDMSATKITEHTAHVVEFGGDKLLSAAAIYGSNASGKSNVYEAFAFMRDYVTSSFFFGGNSERKGEDIPVVTPFLFDRESRNQASEFEVFYIDNSDKRERTYQYGFSLQGTEVIEEWLYSKAKTNKKDFQTIFYRKKGEELVADGLPRKAVVNLKNALLKETLIVSLGAKLNIPRLTSVYDWFSKNVGIRFTGNVDDFYRSSDLPIGFVEDKAVQEDVLSYLSSFDESIIDFEIEEIRRSDDKLLGKAYIIHTIHRLSDGGFQSILLKNESNGTRKMLSLYRPLRYALDHGGVIFIDEMNDRLHPLLVRNIILTFLNPEVNPNHAQLIFTTHDVWQFTNELLRRDELWVTDKNSDGVSILYSVADFKDAEGKKIRRDEALVKKYLVGNYGGVPELKPLFRSDRRYLNGE